jgi:hypothetical protein
VTDIVRPGAGVLFMKVGTHAREPLEAIIERKQAEIDDAGYALWGYGGNTCHPVTMVQPFARDFEVRGQTIHLCMQPMQSSHFAERTRAVECSADGIAWDVIPPSINVLGSRFALAVGDLQRTELTLPLEHTRVAVGPSVGRRGDQYVQGRVDKACLEVVDEPADPTDDAVRPIEIGLVARLIEPYAVFVRN